jgi:lysyl-tRNA synthetase class 2
MEESRLAKLNKLRERGLAYPYRYEISHNLGELRRKYEREPQGERVKIRGKVKRVSKQEDSFLIRLEDQRGGVEMLVRTTQGLKQGEGVVLGGVLTRWEGKLTLDQAVVSEGDAFDVSEIKEKYDMNPEDVEVSVAGRLITLRPMGKALFAHLQDATGKLQIYLRQDIMGEASFKDFEETIDPGDLLGVRGRLFRTNTGELTVEVKEWSLLAKSLHPLPEKWHGLKDVEVRYRQRYLDLIANEHARKVFFFLEVETPILQPIASGANAKPFITYHNYLEQNLYLRIAPELYLKRLIVGGINRVYELGKNFRNEGVDTTHNPEFTMLEFYCAYWDYKDLMVFTEELFSYLLNQLVGGLKITYQGKELDFTPPFKRYRYFELLEEKTGKNKDFFLRDVEGLRKLAKEIGVPKAETLTHAKLIDKVFDLLVEDELWGPCFVIDFPKLLSPLAKTHREDPDLVERFELFVAGKEIANAYTELNDPIEQKERFLEQLKEKEMGDEEAMAMDEDFIRALEYGMPPTAGEGIGIDRLVMLLADVDSIREVILFPALRQKT